jgi:serine/threonine-protein kinase
VSQKAQRAAAYRIFCAALAQEESTRDTFVQQECGGDAGLIEDVRGLIGSLHADSLETAALRGSGPDGSGPAVAPESLIGRSVGRFRLLECIGQGGMGIVFRAERTDGVRQTVAVKLLSTQLGTGARSRFEREAQLLASLEHPSIARLIDAGIEDSQAWIALEFVRGERIDQYCGARAPGVAAILRLVTQLADAVAAAHALLIVHSDIKPANVLVGADGLPKLVDFGIATALRDADPTMPVDTPAGLLFTPHYAAPEQLRGERITVATDVFGLGALCYRLLCGVPPYDHADSALAYLRAVHEGEVTLPSEAARRAGRSLAVSRQLRGDLDAILSRALARDPSQRYASVTALQADLQRHLDGRPVSARPATGRYRLGKFLRRNALATGLTGLLAASLLAGGIVAGLQMRRANIAQQAAAQRDAFLEDLLKSANPWQGRRDATVAELLDAAAKSLDAKLGAEPLVEASMLGLIAETSQGLGRYPQALDANARQIELLRRHGGSATDLSLALSERGKLLILSARNPEAEALLQEAIALTEHVRGAEGALAEALDDLGVVYQNLARGDAAASAYRRALDVYRGAGRDFGVVVSDPIANLGVLYFDEGRYADAAALMRQAVELRRRYLPPEHPDLMDAEFNYASSLEQDHQAPAAEPLFRQLYAAYQRVLGPDHIDTLMAEQGIAHNLLVQKRYAEAAAVGLPAAEGMSRVAGMQHDWTLTAWDVYGLAACRGDDVERGLAALRRVAALRHQDPVAGLWRAQLADVQLGDCLVALGKYAEAESLLRTAAAGLEQTRGARYEHTQQAYRALLELYRHTGRAADAAAVEGKLQ